MAGAFTAATLLAACSTTGGATAGPHAAGRPAGATPSTTTPPTTTPPTTLTPPTTTPPTTATPAAVLPDSRYTPGAVNPLVTQADIGRTVCRSGWTETVRPPESYTEEVKHREDGGGGIVSYEGATYPVHGFRLPDTDISHFELDHLVPLELGGAPADPSNLWMQPYEPPRGTAAAGTGSQTKDAVENAARSAVCDGRMSLASAQSQMAANWYAFGVSLGVLSPMPHGVSPPTG